MTPTAPTRSRRPAARLLLTAALFAGCALGAVRGEVVILKDGFVMQGDLRKEKEPLLDPATGKLVPLVKANGFDFIDEGPKVWIFSTHAKQLGQVSKDVKIRPEYRAYKWPIPARKSSHPLPATGMAKSVTEFNEKWRRTLTVTLADEPGVVKGRWEVIEQQITYLDPYTCWITSTTHAWRITFRTSELDPRKVRQLLAWHPELKEADDKPDPAKRVAIGKFMLDAGWLAMAKEEVERMKKECPGPYEKDVKEQHENLLKEIDAATAQLVVNEAELALAAGRYRYAGELLAVFPEKTADPKDTDKATKLMAVQKEAMARFETGRRLLREVLDDATGGAVVRGGVAAGGGPAAVVWPRRGPEPNTPLARLAAAGEHVYAELHPDSIGRIEFFVNLAGNAQAERKKPEELLATAVSGWVKGKAGSTTQSDIALRLWTARELVLAYQRADDLNTRNRLLFEYRKTSPLGMDELAQVITQLPPAEPEDLANRTGTPVTTAGGVPPGVYRRKTPATADRPTGIDYMVKLPPEYHHGRAYPVVVALTHPTMEPEKMTAALARETDKHGYILLAPDWSTFFARGWQWKGEDHDFVTAVLRDAIRHFTVDNDRVFLFGAGDGANAAMDVGMGHPDLFAGVLAMGPIPRHGMFMEYWRNAQKLPFYIVTGEHGGDSVKNLRSIFEHWMPHGFPAVMAVYKGRGVEWYSAEPPVMFDWMSRKKRVNGTATLKLGPLAPPQWQTMRLTDNRFYWIGTDKIDPRNLLENVAPGKNPFPAAIGADIRNGNFIDIRSRGVRTVTIWLGRDMIDWEKTVSVRLNNDIPLGYKPKKLEQDIGVLLEDYRERGDRRMLFLAKLEFNTRS
jgi:hypothetical protein